MAPNAVIKTTVEKFAKGVCKKNKIRQAATIILNNYNCTQVWNL
jgi:hypothetical protein